MFSSESLTQIDIFTFAMMKLFPALRYVVYDNACGVVRHVKKQVSARAGAPQQVAAWRKLSQLHWVIDRLHATYHRACKDETGGWYVPNITADCFPDLDGADTEAAEQVFHIANRWQTVLSNTAAAHQELFMLIFAREHNKAHSCAKAETTYRLAQRRRVVEPGRPDACAGQSAAPPLSPLGQAGLDTMSVGSCDACQPKAKKAKLVKTFCQISCACEGAGRAGTEADTDAQASASSRDTGEPATKDIGRDTWVVVNERSKTVHRVILPSDVYSVCSWSFQGRAKVVRARSQPVDTLWTCAICFGVRAACRHEFL